MFIPGIATKFPEHLQAQARAATSTEEVDDTMNRLEEDPYKAGQEPQDEEEQQGSDSLEKDELVNPKKK
jgi:hypothetical protein